MKIFVIGFNKTGTSSLHELFKRSNINSVHTTKPIIEIIDKYDAFTDGDHINFEDYYNKYPDSLFILNTRPISNWLISRYKHALRTNFQESWCWPVSQEKTNQWITKRELRYQKILHFFSNKIHQLLIVNIEKQGWENKVLNYIKKKPITFQVHKNIRNSTVIPSDKMKLITENVSNCLIKRGYTGDELLCKNLDIKLYNFENFL